jgi:hypothetical protein
MSELRRLGARSIPVVSKGDEWVFAQSLGDVSKFLSLDVDTAPKLTMTEMAQRLDVVLVTAQRLVRQIPDSLLENKLRNRDRTYRSLCFHIFRVAETFLEVTEGVTLTRDSLVADPPESIKSFNQIADYGVSVQGKVETWWNATSNHDPAALLTTYYGDQPIHNVFERTTWHCAQHTRQLAMLLQGADTDMPLTPAQLDGLPVPEKVWDD